MTASTNGIRAVKLTHVLNKQQARLSLLTAQFFALHFLSLSLLIRCLSLLERELFVLRLFLGLTRSVGACDGAVLFSVSA